MTDMTQEDALNLADALAGQALKETETRCALLAKFIDDCDQAGAATAAWSAALGELSALHERRRGLLRRRELIKQALDCLPGESPARTPLAAPAATASRLQRQVQRQVQVQVQVKRRPRSGT